MDLVNLIGYKFDEAKSLLNKYLDEYDVIEVFDTKNTKLGDDLRIINISLKDKARIYVAYF